MFFLLKWVVSNGINVFHIVLWSTTKWDSVLWSRVQATLRSCFCIHVSMSYDSFSLFLIENHPCQLKNNLWIGPVLLKKYNLYVYIWKFPSCIEVLSISPFSLDLILLFSNSFLLECLVSLFEFIYYLQQLRSHSSFGCWRRMWVLYWYLFIFRCVVGFLRMFPLLINSKKFLSNLVSTLKKLCKNHLRFGVWVQWISPVAQGHVCMCPLTTSSWNRA